MKEIEFTADDREEFELKNIIVNYVGDKTKPENDEVTLDNILDVFIEEFPEMILAIAEENYLRGYKQAITDIDQGADFISNNPEKLLEIQQEIEKMKEKDEPTQVH